MCVNNSRKHFFVRFSWENECTGWDELFLSVNSCVSRLWATWNCQISFGNKKAARSKSDLEGILFAYCCEMIELVLMKHLTYSLSMH